MVKVKCEFLGGLDQTFNGVRELKVVLPFETVSVGELVKYLAEEVLDNEADREVFLQEGGVRPGILVLVNDTDWELEGEAECVLEDGDVVAFTSTLHGG